MTGGHGHVTPRPDGAKARCGGPGLCAQCSTEKAQKDNEQKSNTPPQKPTSSARVALAVLVAVAFSGCATLHRHPGPIGTPSPEACFASQQALDAWVRYVEPYIRATLEGQAAHSCTPPEPPAPATPAD